MKRKNTLRSKNYVNIRGEATSDICYYHSGIIFEVTTDDMKNGKDYTTKHTVKVKKNSKLFPIALRIRKGDVLEIEGLISFDKKIIPTQFLNLTHAFVSHRKDAVQRF